ncbi:endo-1,3-1,4-beta glucanase-related protein [Bacteroidia bacterium]|nr:endo-1,3-1,4-beta glucanase-related protein [Bacteroidia bacterium]
MKTVTGITLLLLGTVTVYGQKEDYPAPQPMTHEMTEFWTPQPKVVTPGKSNKKEFTAPPSDAIILFDGKDLSQWEKAPDKNVLVKGKDLSKFQSTEGSNAQWIVKDGVLTVNKQAGDIQTRQVFGDFQFHIEWRIPEGIKGESQLRGNSGVFLQGIYEVQILDSYNSVTYANGQAGSIYKQTAPLANAMNPPGEWNTYDIIYTAPTFKSDGTYRTRPVVTVLHNGILIQNNTQISGTTPYIGLPQVVEHGKGPVRLQAHADESAPVGFRNIWIREL